MAGGYGSKYFTGNFKWVKKLILPPLPIQNIIPKDIYIKIGNIVFRKEYNILNIGSGDNTGVGSNLWKYELGNVVNLDIEYGENVDIVGDAHYLPLSDDSFDSVIMQAVLEHLHSPIIAIDEAFRVLKPGGFLYLEVPFLQGFHADPHDYYRFTQKCIEKIIDQKGEMVLKGVSSGPFSVLNWIIRDLFSNLSNYKVLNLLIRFVISWLFFPLKYFDFLVANTKACERLACENYYLIKKNK